MKGITKKAASLLAIIILATGQITTQKGYAGVNEFSEAMRALGAIKAMNQIQPIFLDPIVREKIETVYIEVFDLTGLMIPAESLREKIKSSFAAKGYTIVDSPKEAGYVIQIILSNIYLGKEKRGTSGVGGSILGTIGGYAGLIAGIGAGPLGMQIGSAIGSAIGETVGEKAEEKILDSMTGKNYQYFGTFNIIVTENYNGNTKTYNGIYPIAGNGKDFSIEKFVEELATGIDRNGLSVFNKSSRKPEVKQVQEPKSTENTEETK